MDPITASGVFSLGKEIISRVSSSLLTDSSTKPASFDSQLDASKKATTVAIDPNLQAQKLESSLKAQLLKDPETANFFQQNQNNNIFLEKRADGSVQFVSSNGKSLILEKNSVHCTPANDLLELCFENKINLTAMRPNAVTFNS